MPDQLNYTIDNRKNSFPFGNTTSNINNGFNQTQTSTIVGGNEYRDNNMIPLPPKEVRQRLKGRNTNCLYDYMIAPPASHTETNAKDLLSPDALKEKEIKMSELKRMIEQAEAELKAKNRQIE